MFNIQCSTLVIFGGIFIGRIRHLVFYNKDIYIYFFVNRIKLLKLFHVLQKHFVSLFYFLLLLNVIHGSSHRLLFCEIPVFLFLVKKLEGHVWGVCFIEPSGCRKYNYLKVT